MTRKVDPAVIEKLRRLMAQDPRAAEKLARLMGAPPAVDPVVGEMIRDSSYGATFDGVPAREMVRGGGPGAYQSDFDAQLARMNQAAALHPGNELDASVADLALQRQALEAIAPFVRTQPTTIVGRILGAQTVLTSGQTSGDLVFFAGDDTESVTMTVTGFNVGATGAVNWPAALSAGVNPISYRPFLRCKWGTRAFLTTADFDIDQPVTLTGSSCYVQLGIAAAQATYVAGTMTLGCHLAFGPRASPTPVLKTEYVDNLAAAGTSSILVPRFAKSLMVYRSLETAAFTLDFRDTNNAAKYSVTVGASTNMTTPIPVTNDIYNVLVTNSGGSASHFRLAFGLVL